MSIRIGLSTFSQPGTPKVFAGTVTKKGVWGANKTDVTQDFLATLVAILRIVPEGLEIHDGNVTYEVVMRRVDDA